MLFRSVSQSRYASGQGYADLHFVIPEFIDKVNFDKGPYFAEKGNFTTAGFVDFKTKDFLENNFAKLEVGQFKTYRGVLGLNLLKNNKEIKDQSLFLATEAYFTDGYFESPQDFNRFNGMLKYHGKLNDNNPYRDWETDRKSTRLNSSHRSLSRMPSSA